MVSLGLILLAFLTKSLAGIVVILAATLLVYILCGLGNLLGRILRLMGPVLLLAFLLWSVLYKYSLFHHYSESGVSFSLGAFMALRLLVLILAPLAYIATTTPSELVLTLESLKLPRQFAMLLGLTFRYVFSISQEYEAIREAQMSRGVELDSGSLVRRIRNHIPIVMPLLVRSAEIAERVSLAMELKLSSAGTRRTRFFQLKIHPLDYAIVSGVAALVLAVMALGGL